MASDLKLRVRFAPSPTGYLHVGGARTALFNWLYARREGGTLILRIEDTDVERNRPELVDGILEGLRWLGVEWDEGPYFQSKRLEMYTAAAEKLLASGAAFPCYCRPAQYGGAEAAVEEGEEGAEKKERAAPCPCREMSAAKREEKQRQGLPRAIRFAVPRTGVTRFEDAVFGAREVQNVEIEDFVLLRSSGLPTYQLSVVVDDIDMHVTHIIRGADHLSNTPKQVLLYRAMDAEPPVFAHVPLILGPDRTRLSKRHGATSVSSYAAEGFLPEAFRNFLALLGWSTGSDEEFLRTTELIARFSLGGVSRTNAVFDRAKLEWFNSQYLQRLGVEEVLPYVKAELQRAGLWREAWDSSEREWFARAVDLLRPRTRLLLDFSTWARAFFADDFDYDPEAKKKFWKDERVPTLLAKLADALQAIPEWNHDACDHALRALAEAEGVKAGLLINATRVAIVGRAVAPPLFDTMVVLGKSRVIERLHRAVPFASTQ
ncbi:MAG TPA: glutamate--tRNA ligase [Candidatus Acidoferrales bacterium]|nr:glutamate--tRNA ligase [Candidatus Acidoferrales bacterium]